jgi:UPF0755 protein
MKFVRFVFVLAVLAALGAAGAAYLWVNKPLALAAESVEVAVEQGTPPRAIAQAWVDAGVKTSPLFLYEYFRWSGQSKKIRAGSYEIGLNTTSA